MAIERIKNIKILLLGVVSLALGWVLPDIYKSVQLSYVVNGISDIEKDAYEQSEYEIALIYIGNSECPAANKDIVPTTFKKIRKKLAKEADENSFRFIAIGIANENFRSAELEHLSNFGKFDEVLIGNDWSNTGILNYIYMTILVVQVLHPN